MIEPIVVTLVFAGGQFCSGWNRVTDRERLEFLQSKTPVVMLGLKEPPHSLSDDDLSKWAVCYEKRLPALKGTINQDCLIEATMSRFFRAQVDSSDQVYSHITQQINQCLREISNGE